MGNHISQKIIQAVLAGLLMIYAVSALAAEQYGQIFPVDESQRSRSLPQFLRSYDEIVRNRDFEAVKAFLDVDILNSFGGDGGIDEFVQLWGNRQDELFKTLQDIRLGGGKLTASPGGDEMYCMPRRFTDFPEHLDAFSYGVIVGVKVPVYDSPGEKHREITRLTHAIVKVNEWTSARWQQIELRGGIKAYVLAARIRSPIDYRACFARDDRGKWKMRHLVAGD